MMTWLLAAIDPEPHIPITEASLAFVVVVLVVVAAVIWIRRKPVAHLGERAPGDPRRARPLILSGAVLVATAVAIAVTLRVASLVGPVPSLSAAPSATAPASANPTISAAPSQSQPPAMVSLPAVRLGPATCANIAEGWAVDIPAGWWYSAGIDPCLYLDPAGFDVTLNAVTRDTAIQLKLVAAGIGTFDRILFQESLVLAGHPTTRWELESLGPEGPADSLPAGTRTYQYIVQIEFSSTAEVNFVATVSSAHVTDYAAAKATLDELMRGWRHLESQLLARLDLFSEIPGYVSLPSLVLTADGRLVWTDPQTGRLLVRRLTSTGIATFQERLQQTGLFEADGTYEKEPLPGVTPPGRGGGYAQFTVLNRHGTLVRVIAIPIDPDEAQYWIITPERRALDDLRQALTDPEAWLPADVWAQPSSTAYAPDQTTLILSTNPGTGAPAGQDAADLGSPFDDPEHFGSSADSPDVHKLGTIRCGVLPAQDAAAIIASLLASGQLQEYPSEMGAQLPWAAGAGSLGVDLIPVRPDGSPGCDEVSG